MLDRAGRVRHSGQDVYDVAMVKRTNINLDVDLVREAASELGTRQTTETVHAALREVVRRAGLQRLAEEDFVDLTPELLEQTRRPRTFKA